MNRKDSGNGGGNMYLASSFGVKKMGVWAFGLGGGVLGYLFGGFDLLFHTFLLFVALDIVSGIVSASYNGVLKSREIKRGLIRKLGDLIIIIVAVGLDKLIFENGLATVIEIPSFFGNELSIRAAVLGIFIIREAISITENLVKMDVYVPAFLKKWLEVAVGEEGTKQEIKSEVEAIKEKTKEVEESAKKVEDLIEQLPNKNDDEAA